jgi:gas vesicle protein
MFGKDRAGSARAQGFGVGLLIGALVGAGAALLMAPATGDETRRLLRRNAKRMYARSGDALAESWEVAERRAKRLAKRANLRV